MSYRWNVELLGRLRATNGDLVVTRFRTQKTASLFAYLTYHIDRPHPREELIDRFWPDVELMKGRESLSTALSSLRHQFELPNWPSGSVIIADRMTVRMNSTNVMTDIGAYEKLVRQARSTRVESVKLANLAKAATLYRGPLLPGLYDDWIQFQRQRLADTFLNTVAELAGALEANGDFGQAVAVLHRAVAVDPFNEDIRGRLMRLYLAHGEPALALREFQALRTSLNDELGVNPSPALCQLAAESELRIATAAELLNSTDPQGSEGGSADEPIGSTVAPYPRLPTPSIDPDTGIAEPAYSFTALETAADWSELPEVASPDYRGRIPIPLNRFFGRSAELDQLQDLVLDPEVRLVSVTGTGGIGKTRLAIHAALAYWPLFRGNVWYVSLVDCVDPGRIPDEIAKALELDLSATDLVDEITSKLSFEPVLLVLDNFEHLVEGGLWVVERLLQALPMLTCLITTRSRLNSPAEREFPLEPLPIPRATSSIAEIASSDTIQLFVDRAQAVRPDFQITADNSAALVGLCAQLEGLPLAIELAAARSQVFTPKQILERLGNRLDLLSSRRKDLPPRHQTLRAVVESSFALLSPELQQFMARLSVFKGGWTVEAAEAVCEEPLALNYLAELRDCSLVVVFEVDNMLRMRMLETIREFSWERLVQAGEAGEVQLRHAMWFLGLCEEAAPHYHGLDGLMQIQWLQCIEADHDNVRAGLDWTIEERRLDLAYRYVLSLEGFWYFKHYWSEARIRLKIILELEPQPTDEILFRLLGRAGSIALHQGELFEARIFAERSLQICRRRGLEGSIAGETNLLANILSGLGETTKAFELYEESLRLFREVNDTDSVAMLLNNMGTTFHEIGELRLARKYLDEALSIRVKSDDQYGIALVLENLGLVNLAEGRLKEARVQLSRSLEISYQLRDNWASGTCLHLLAELSIREGDLIGAHTQLCESIDLKLEIFDKVGLISALELAAQMAFQLSVIDSAARLLAAADSLREESGARRIPIDSLPLKPLYDAFESAVDCGRFESLRIAGTLMGLSNALTEARSLADCFVLVQSASS